MTSIQPGSARPLGATASPNGVNFAVYSSHATRVELVLFDAVSGEESARHGLPGRTGNVWHGLLPPGFAGAGTHYAFCAHGPNEPAKGLRFDPEVMLLDPHARALSTAEPLRSRVIDGSFDWSGDRPPATPWRDTVIYELHVKGHTQLHPDVPEAWRGRYLGLTAPAVIEHCKSIGVTAVELLPCQSFMSEAFLRERGLRNYWGYNPVAWFAPSNEFAVQDAVAEFKTMIKALHAAGIEVILDVVFNHTAEGNEAGPMLNMKGLDNPVYYRLQPDLSLYENLTGCGNTVNCNHPHVRASIVECLKYWVEEMHVDGFRFDLASVLGRDDDGFNERSEFFKAVRAEPALAYVKLIAEPWDVGYGGYQLGRFPAGWSEWNDRYRDTLRAFWRRDPGRIGELAERFAGSSDLFRHDGRKPSAGINFITAHDGFTLHDLVSYNERHNLANGEANADGHHDNFSWNCGTEGPTEDARINALRRRQTMNLLATLFLSQGVPMLQAGDEFGRTQRGNNNAYAQDNELSWTDWSLRTVNRELLEFVRSLAALRREHAEFRRETFLKGTASRGGVKDVTWLNARGSEMTQEDWQNPASRTLGIWFGRRSPSAARFILLLNADDGGHRFELPAAPAEWVCRFDTGTWPARPAVAGVPRTGSDAVFTRSARIVSRCWRVELDVTLIERLARLRGVGDAYHDYRGELQYFTLETKSAILRAMGSPVDDPAALAQELARIQDDRLRALLPPVAVSNGTHIAVDLNITARDFGASLIWAVTLEQGERRTGTRSTADCPELWRGDVGGSLITRRRFELPLELPPGRHELEMRIGAGSESRCALVISPPRCHEPRTTREAGRLWGVAVQLYTVRSRENWGIGDFGDLQGLIRWLAPCGAGFIGLNPLHALAPADPERASPYSASNRHFLNVLYIAVPAVPEYQESAEAGTRVAEAAFAARLEALRNAPLVDYRGVADVKLQILELLFREFRNRHLAPGTERAAAFASFVAAGGAPLKLHARFDALDEYLRATRGTPSGWLSWPSEFKDPQGAAAECFAAENGSRIDFHLYLQWLAHEQLVEAQTLARNLGMPIGLYGDYAVGTNPSGSETWVDQTGFRLGAEIGAPPDPLALKGQGWGLPPPDPVVMESDRLEGFARLLGNNMRYYGALRLDHVMSLFRLWWVPAGRPPTEGAYVHYPLHQLLCLLSLESARHACIVVGEDLGVVPDEMRRAMPEFGLYHYKVLLFEKVGERLRAPGEFVREALATVTTHDMPTLRSFWEGHDIDLRRRLNLYPSAELELAIRGDRERDREVLLAALDLEGLRPASQQSGADAFTPQLAHALHTYLARSSAALAAIQIEDLLGMTEPVNVPGTHHEYPNWQRKLSEGLEDMAARGDFRAWFEDFSRARGPL